MNCQHDHNSSAESFIEQCDEQNTDGIGISTEVENKDSNGSALSTEGVCFLCTGKDLPDPDCKVCRNISLYYSKNGCNGIDNEDKVVNISFPGPGIIKRNHIYGNYVVASRTIEAGELVIIEKPLIVGPYCPPEMLPLCLSCYKDIGLSTKCSRCKWPVCGRDCEKVSLHAENECEIFTNCGLKSKGLLMNEYFSVEVLRALLLREKNTPAWERILEFEPHIEARSNDYNAKAITDFIISFIRYRCNLVNKYSSETIDHVVGILSINTFWAYKDLNRYASCLFNKVTLLSHDCNPNTERKLIYLEEDNNHNETNCSMQPQPPNISTIAIHISASRRIVRGEMISTRYIDINQPLTKRREELKETFYFDCACSRCLCEMSQSTHLHDIETQLMDISLD